MDVIIKRGSDWQPERPRLLAKLREFSALLKKRPFDNDQGLRGVSAFALYWFLQEVQPTHVFEVGVWKGFSTWLIRRALPDAKIFSFDPLVLLEVLLDPAKVGPTYRDPAVTYSYQDFSCADLSSVIAESSCPLAFFDDHQNKLPRLMQSKNLGIKHIIFDDNDSNCPTHRTLEDELLEPESASRLAQLVERYEVFPALWDVDALLMNGEVRINERGLGFPITPDVMEVYNDREWHSYVTYVRLR
ncbi:MAG TPA: hypothetical protein VE863_00810 [Pyrinomonadaceae bacterium]|jgi:trans-aconitate methyltransferase|nr:hypothetical protein [Pyrinomonadaceae bacterium]